MEMLDFNMILLTVFVILFIYYQFFNRCTLDRQLNLRGPFKWPFLGNFIEVMRKGLRNFDAECLDKYGPVVPMAFGGIEQLLISDVELLKLILIKEHKSFTDRVKFRMSGKLLNRGVAALKGQEWSEMRGILTPTFTSGKMKRMLPAMLRVMHKMTRKCEQFCDSDQNIDCKTFFENVTLDISGPTLFGIEIDSLDNPDGVMSLKLRELFAFSFKNPFILLIVFFPSTAKWINRLFPSGGLKRQITDFFLKQFSEILEQRKAATKSVSQRQNKDFIDLMMKAQSDQLKQTRDEVEEENKNNDTKIQEKLSDHDVIAQLITFFIAGFDNNSGTINFVTNILANNPEIQDRIYDEIESAILARRLEKEGETSDVDADPVTLFHDMIDYEMLRSLVYLENVILETSRIYLLAPQIQRVATCDVTLPVDCLPSVQTIHIKKGTQIAFSSYNVHSNPKIFPEPNVFNPDRFNVDRESDFSPSQYLLSFGQGPRNCIGFRFALIQMKLILAFLVFHFRVKRSLLTPRKITQEPLRTSKMTPLNYIKLERRSQLVSVR